MPEIVHVLIPPDAVNFAVAIFLRERVVYDWVNLGFQVEGWFVSIRRFVVIKFLLKFTEYILFLGGAEGLNLL